MRNLLVDRARARMSAKGGGGQTPLEDGNITLDIRESQGSYAVYTTRAGAARRRLGAVPYTQEMSSVSNDGMYTAAFNLTVRNDVYMISNFGKMLRR